MDACPFGSDSALTTGVGCIALGQVFVLTSFYKLGFLGTFLADYFGFLKDEPVTGFPYSQYMSNPMYMGATLSFLGNALMGASPAGIVLTLWVYIVYRVALALEETFTNWIYAERERTRGSGKVKKG
jgi:phosphatidylethanolamine N-methyltransferase